MDDQNRSRWDQLLRRRGIQVLGRAGPSRWRRRVRLSVRIFCRPLSPPAMRVRPGPVVEVNRAVAHGHAHGPEAGLAVLDALGGDPLPGSPLPHVVRGDLLAHLGNDVAARVEFARAAELTENAAERSLLLRRAARGNR